MGNLKHGKRYTKLYSVWVDIKTRCYNPQYKNYKNWGGRGIAMQENWIKDFEAFETYVTSLPKYDADKQGYQLSIDRIDNDSNYCEGNLRWASRSTQNRNRRTQNNNTSGYRGVTFHKANKKYMAQIQVNKKQIYLGLAPTAKEAYQLRANYIKQHNLKGFEI